MSRTRRITLAAALVIGAAGIAGAQVSSSLQSVTLTASKGQLVQLGTPSPTIQSITIADGAINQYTNPFQVSVSWDVVNSSTTTVKFVGYFSTPAQALANGTDYIPSSSIETSIDGGTNWVPVTSGAVGTVGTTNGSVVLYTSPVTSGGNKAGSHSVSFLVRINLTSGPTTVAGNYTGTLNLMAICN